MITADRPHYKTCLKNAYESQVHELRSDIWFFGLLGVLIGFLANAYDRLDQKGVKLPFGFINELMTDFMSVKAIVFVLCLSVMLSALRNLVANSSYGPSLRLETAATHVASRLRQLTSSLSSFSVGFAVALGLTVLSTFEIQSLMLALMVAFVGVCASLFGVFATIIEQRIGESSLTWTSVLMILGTFGYLIVFATRGF